MGVEDSISRRKVEEGLSVEVSRSTDLNEGVSHYNWMKSEKGIYLGHSKVASMVRMNNKDQERVGERI